MDNLDDLFKGLRNLGKIIDEEIPTLYKNLRQDPNAEKDDYHIGYYAFKKLESEVQNQKNCIDDMGKEFEQFVNFNNYVKFSHNIVFELENKSEKVINHLKDYGYVPKIKTEECDEDVRLDENIDKENMSPNSNLDSPVDLDKTPDLADFGLSHMKDLKLSKTSKGPEKFRNILGVGYNQANNVKLEVRADEVECTPAQFSHQGFKTTPGLFKGSTSSCDSPDLEQEQLKYSQRSQRAPYVETPDETIGSSFVKQSVRDAENFSERAANSVKLISSLASQRMYNDPMDLQDIKGSLQFDNESVLIESSYLETSDYCHEIDDVTSNSSYKHQSGNNKNFGNTNRKGPLNRLINQFGEKDTPEEPELTFKLPNKPFQQNYEDCGEDLPPTPKLSYSYSTKPIEEGTSVKSTSGRSKNIVNNGALRGIQNQLNRQHENTPEEPEMTSKFGFHAFSHLDDSRESIPPTPELTAAYRPSRQMPVIPAPKHSNKFNL